MQSHHQAFSAQNTAKAVCEGDLHYIILKNLFNYLLDY